MTERVLRVGERAGLLRDGSGVAVAGLVQMDVTDARVMSIPLQVFSNACEVSIGPGRPARACLVHSGASVLSTPIERAIF